ncbi:MAG: flagellar FlbD family protein [Acidimicrobiia bacterium]|nr:flagellar FlbD family protein [Acidimicrobiia bacterium]
MIQVSRLNDSTIIINADLIEVIEATPDTVITLIDGTRFVVREAPDELIRRIQHYRATLLALRDDPILRSENAPEANLSVVPPGVSS